MGTHHAGSRGVVGKVVALASLAALAAAVTKELRLPRERRSWQGTVLGVVPYDLRPPTLAVIRSRFWAPEDPRIFTPRVFGVGWSVNLARLVDLIRPPR